LSPNSSLHLSVPDAGTGTWILHQSGSQVSGVCKHAQSSAV
jgi:hypothetical protein